MTTIESIQRAIQLLRPAELAEFRRWFAHFDAAAWDAQIKADATAGKLDRSAEEARAEYQGSRTREL